MNSALNLVDYFHNLKLKIKRLKNIKYKFGRIIEYYGNCKTKNQGK